MLRFEGYTHARDEDEKLAEPQPQRVENPLHVFPSRDKRLESVWVTAQAPEVRKAHKKNSRWLDPLDFNPKFGLEGTDNKTEARRAIRRLTTSQLFVAERPDEVSISETLRGEQAPDAASFVMVPENQLVQLASMEEMLRKEKAHIADQCAWLVAEERISARMPLPYVKMAVMGVCDRELKKMSKALAKTHRDWQAHFLRRQYAGPPPETALGLRRYRMEPMPHVRVPGKHSENREPTRPTRTRSGGGGGSGGHRRSRNHAAEAEQEYEPEYDRFRRKPRVERPQGAGGRSGPAGSGIGAGKPLGRGLTMSKSLAALGAELPSDRRTLLKSAPLSLHGLYKLSLRDAAEAANRERELDHMGYEDVTSRLLGRYLDTLDRKRDYGIYYVLAVKYGPLSLAEFNSTARPGRLYMVRCDNAAYRMQEAWARFWPVQKMIKHKAARVIQAQIRGKLARKQWRPIIFIRMHWGRNSYYRLVFYPWKQHVRVIRMMKDFLRGQLQQVSKSIFMAWKQWTRERIANRGDKSRQLLMRLMFSQSAKCFFAWKGYAKKQHRWKHWRLVRAGTPVWRAWRQFVEAARRQNYYGRLLAQGQKCIRGFLTRLWFARIRIHARNCQKLVRGFIARQKFVLLLAEDRRRKFEEEELAVEHKAMESVLERGRKRQKRFVVALREREVEMIEEVRQHVRVFPGKVQLQLDVATLREAYAANIQRIKDERARLLFLSMHSKYRPEKFTRELRRAVGDHLRSNSFGSSRPTSEAGSSVNELFKDPPPQQEQPPTSNAETLSLEQGGDDVHDDGDENDNHHHHPEHDHEDDAGGDRYEDGDGDGDGDRVGDGHRNRDADALNAGAQPSSPDASATGNGDEQALDDLSSDSAVEEAETLHNAAAETAADGAAEDTDAGAATTSDGSRTSGDEIVDRSENQATDEGKEHGDSTEQDQDGESMDPAFTRELEEGSSGTGGLLSSKSIRDTYNLLPQIPTMPTEEELQQEALTKLLHRAKQMSRRVGRFDYEAKASFVWHCPHPKCRDVYVTEQLYIDHVRRAHPAGIGVNGDPLPTKKLELGARDLVARSHADQVEQALQREREKAGEDVDSPYPRLFCHFHIVLLSEFGRETLSHFADVTYGAGPVRDALDMWYDLQHWRTNTVNSDGYNQEAQDIYDTYLSPEAPRPVDLSTKTMRRIRERFERFKIREFDGFYVTRVVPYQTGLSKLLGRTREVDFWTEDNVLEPEVFDMVEWEAFHYTYDHMDEGYDLSGDGVVRRDKERKAAAEAKERRFVAFTQAREFAFLEEAQRIKGQEYAVVEMADDVMKMLPTAVAEQEMDQWLEEEVEKRAVEVIEAIQVETEAPEMMADEVVDLFFDTVFEETLDDRVGMLASLPSTEEELAYNERSNKKSKVRLERQEQRLRTLVMRIQSTGVNQKKLLLLQRWARGEAGRRIARKRLAQRWRKQYDAQSGYYYYKDVLTGQSQWERPLLFARLFKKTSF